MDKRPSGDIKINSPTVIGGEIQRSLIEINGRTFEFYSNFRLPTEGLKEEANKGQPHAVRMLAYETNMLNLYSEFVRRGLGMFVNDVEPAYRKDGQVITSMATFYYDTAIPKSKIFEFSKAVKKLAPGLALNVAAAVPGPKENVTPQLSQADISEFVDRVLMQEEFSQLQVHSLAYSRNR